MGYIIAEVISVSRRKSSQIGTYHITYTKEGEQKKERIEGAEWEEIELQIKLEDKPSIQVANTEGDAFFAGGTVKLIVNNSDMFGTFHIRDIIPLIVAKETETSSLPQSDTSKETQS